MRSKNWTDCIILKIVRILRFFLSNNAVFAVGKELFNTIIWCYDLIGQFKKISIIIFFV